MASDTASQSEAMLENGRLQPAILTFVLVSLTPLTRFLVTCKVEILKLAMTATCSRCSKVYFAYNRHAA